MTHKQPKTEGMRERFEWIQPEEMQKVTEKIAEIIGMEEVLEDIKNNPPKEDKWEVDTINN